MVRNQDRAVAEARGVCYGGEYNLSLRWDYQLSRSRAMSLLGNLIWLIFGGFLAGIGYILGGILVCLTLVGIPFGQQAIKLGVATMTPFGREIVPMPEAGSLLNMILNLIWLLVLGWGIALTHLTSGLILAVTIIGLPFALQHFKLIPLALFPFGRELR